MINSALVMYDWSNVSIEALDTNLLFKEDPLAEAISNEISFEEGNFKQFMATVFKYILKIKDYVVDRAKAIGDFVAGQRYKLMGERTKTFMRYLTLKLNTAATEDNYAYATKLYSSDSGFAKGLDNAIATLNNHLDRPYEDAMDFLHEMRTSVGAPMVIANKISERSKRKQVPSVEKLMELLNAASKAFAETERLDWVWFDRVNDNTEHFQHFDEIRFILNDHSLFNDKTEEMEQTAKLIRDLFSGGKETLAETTSIYNPTTNTNYISALSVKLPNAVKELRKSEGALNKIKKTWQGMSEDGSTIQPQLRTIQAYMSVIGSLAGYFGQLMNLVSTIDGYNAAIMTAMKYIDPSYLKKHINSRGPLGNGSSELDTQAYALLLNDSDVIEMALEHYELHDVKEEMRALSDNYVNAVAIESRIQAYGVCLKDAVALESMKPNCFNGSQLTDMFDLRPSMRNAEVALEITSILKSALFTVLVTLVIKYMNQIIEFIETKLSKARIERAIKTMARFRVSITKKVPTADQYKEQNSNIMDGIQKRRGLDNTGTSKPGGATHASTVKARPMAKPVDDKPSLKRDLYKNVLIPLFGVDDNAGAGLASCTDAQDFLRFLNSVNVKGPMMFANDPINKTRKLVVLANTMVANLHNISRGMDNIKKQLDGFIAGTRNEPYFVTEANGPMREFIGDHSTEDVSVLSKRVKEEIAIYMRRNTLVGSTLFRDPKMIMDTFQMLQGFKNDEAIRSLNKFSTDIKGVSASAQASLDKFLKVESDPERKATVEAAVKKYIGELRDLAEALAAVVQAISKAVSYTESIANAVNIFIEG